MIARSKERLISGLILLMAVVLATVALVVMLIPADATNPEEEVGVSSPSPTATASITASPSPTIQPSATLTPLPTADSAVIATQAAQPLVLANNRPDLNTLSRGDDPFTINPQSQRDQIIVHVVQRGETPNDIATRYNITTDTLIWSNRRFYMNSLLPGFEMRILPLDGAIHRVENPVSIQALADRYLVDPYAIIDSDFNNLKDASPENLLPVGLDVVIPNGIGAWEPLYYEPEGSVYANVESVGSGLTRIYNGTAVFGEGQPGSCGEQPIYSGGLPSVRPTRGYVLSNDYTPAHGGVDLAGTLGDNVYAVGDGTVIFAGWSTWGYGWTVVIAHGPVMSLYAHLTGDTVWCGQSVTAGQVIGYLGSSGNSSGPHVHFEIRNAAGTRQNPHNYLSW